MYKSTLIPAADEAHMQRTARMDLIQELRERTQRIEAASRNQPAAEVAPAPEGLDRLLPDQGFRRGSLVEWQSDGEGSGAIMLALATAAHILQRGGALVVIDCIGDFYPPAAAHLGTPLDRTIIVRPADQLTGLWAWEQSLRCSAVVVTLGRIEEMNDRLAHRLQLAAEAGRGLGFMLRSATRRAMASWASVRLRVRGLPGPGPLQTIARHLRVEPLHRGEMIESAVELELSNETGHVRLVSKLADPATARRKANA
jgi:protein ImuA